MNSSIRCIEKSYDFLKLKNYIAALNEVGEILLSVCLTSVITTGNITARLQKRNKITSRTDYKRVAGR